MNLGKVKVWVGVGAYVLSGAATVAIAAPDRDTQTAQARELNNTEVALETRDRSSGLKIAQGGEGGASSHHSSDDH